MLITQEKNFKFHRFQYFSRFYEYGDLTDFELQYDEDHIAFDLVRNFDSKYSNVKGITERFPDDETIILFLLVLYMKDIKKFNYGVIDLFLFFLLWVILFFITKL